MTQLHVLPDVVEHCLNHIEENRTKRVYQRHTYDREMLAAWKILGKHLTRLAALNMTNAAASDDKSTPPKKVPTARKKAASEPGKQWQFHAPSPETAPTAQMN